MEALLIVVIWEINEKCTILGMLKWSKSIWLMESFESTKTVIKGFQTTENACIWWEVKQTGYIVIT